MQRCTPTMPFDLEIRRAFWLLPLPLLALAAFLSAQGVAALVASTLALDASALVESTAAFARTTPSTPLRRVVDATPILDRNPFDHVTGPLREPARDAGIAGPTALDGNVFDAPVCEGVDVRAVAASNDVDWSFASLIGEGGREILLRRGGTIGGRKVYFIGADRVWLSGDGTLCQARLFDQKEILPASAPSAPPPGAPSMSMPPMQRMRVPTLPPDLRAGIQRVGPTEFNIDRTVLDRILENQADLMRQARVVPVQENGRVVGVRVLGIRPDSLLGVLGMQNGDRLQTINGFDLGSPEKALEAYARLRTADKMTVQLNRGGRPMTLDYNIR